jgi:SM-20-related protein
MIFWEPIYKPACATVCSSISREVNYTSRGGKNIDFQKDKAVRRDQVYWLAEKGENKDESEFLNLIQLFMDYLNSNCFTALNSFECHYALYQPGAFYKRHLDQFRQDDSRKFSLICYLNENWKLMDGGELSLFLAEGEKQIAPIGGRLVCFESGKIEHEVKETQRERLSITGWLKTGGLL